jgi:hypothetical protein
VEDLLKPTWQHWPNSVYSLAAPLQVTVSHISMGQVLEVLKQVVLEICSSRTCQRHGLSPRGEAHNKRIWGHRAGRRSGRLVSALLLTVSLEGRVAFKAM